MPIWEDSTNQDLRYARNRIRQELLPYLREHFNPQVETTLAQTAELLRSDLAFLDAAAIEVWQQAVVIPAQGGHGKLNRQVLQQVSLAMQRRVLRRFLQTALDIAPTFEPVEKLQALITAPNRSQTDPFPGGAIARVEGEWIVLDCRSLPEKG